MMKYAIVVSQKDDAGMNIKEHLLSNYDFKLNADNGWICGDIGLVEIKEESIYAEHIDRQVWADFIVFATKHKSSAGKNSLCVHYPGNWGKAEMGGRERMLCTAPASLMKNVFASLSKKVKKLKDYEITLEATHHGPMLEKPCFFVEIGSSDEQWRDPKAGRVVADSIMSVLVRKTKSYETLLGIGGTHYPESFTRIVLDTEYAVSHICPKYALETIDRHLIMQAVEKTCEKVSFAALDWKSLGRYKSKVVEILDRMGIEFEKTKNILNGQVK